MTLLRSPETLIVNTTTYTYPDYAFLAEKHGETETSDIAWSTAG